MRRGNLTGKDEVHARVAENDGVDEVVVSGFGMNYAT